MTIFSFHMNTQHNASIYSYKALSKLNVKIIYSEWHGNLAVSYSALYKLGPVVWAELVEDEQKNMKLM
jgi:hypothetical protein